MQMRQFGLKLNIKGNHRQFGLTHWGTVKLNKRLFKKGFTLIEVVVALGILAAVFAGTVTLVVTVVKLALSSRIKTEAITLAQKGLAVQIQNTYKAPKGVPVSSYAETLDGINLIARTEDPTTADFDLTSNGSSVSFDSDGFYHITSTVTWPGSKPYVLEQYVRKVDK
jgi:prepilin-type N-terminal cleavage/methylation domain-containing protein